MAQSPVTLENLPCDAFRKNPDGSWTCIKPVILLALQNPQGQLPIRPGFTFKKGVKFMSMDIAKILDKKCST